MYRKTRNQPAATYKQRQFTEIANVSVPRSSFHMPSRHITAIDAGLLVPFYCEEVLPGDTFNVKVGTKGWLATPLHPIMDTLSLDYQMFFVPTRIVWANFVKMMGERDNPDDSTDFIVPTTASGTGGHLLNSLQDYFGIPIETENLSYNALPLRCYNKIYNDWYRDQNLQDAVEVPLDDGPDPRNFYNILRRGKFKDYLTSSLPFAQAGEPVRLPLGDSAPVSIFGDGVPTFDFGSTEATILRSSSGGGPALPLVEAADDLQADSDPMEWNDPNLIGTADLTEATSATIAEIREAFAVQKILERDARGGTRYVEQLLAQFGVTSPDFRLQRAEFLGSGSDKIGVMAVPQTSDQMSGGQGAETPQGNLAAFGGVDGGFGGFTASFTEHGYVIGIMSMRTQLTYQQNLIKMWNRSTRFDFFTPALGSLGDQAVLRKEIFVDGTVEDDTVWGYAGRFDEMRFGHSKVTGIMRSSASESLDTWHLTQDLLEPKLNAAFIEENPPVDRVIATPDDPHLIVDVYCDVRIARPMPSYGTPGNLDRF